MALSKNTLDHLLEAESHIRAAVKSAAVNEKPLVVKQLADLLHGLEQCKKFDEIMAVSYTHLTLPTILLV